MRNMRKVKPPPCNIAGKKIADLHVLKLSEDRSTFILAESRVYIPDIVKILPERGKQLINHVTGITEDEHLLNLFHLKILDELCHFIFWVVIGKIMINACRRLPFRNKGDMPGVTQAIMS